MPARGSELGAKDSGASFVPSLHNLQQISGFRLGQGDQHPLVQDQQGDLPVELHHVHVAAFATGDRQLIEQIRQPDIFHCVQISASSRTESAGNIRFSSACGAHEDHIALVQDVPASTQLLQEIPVELSVRAVLNILYTGIGKI